MNNKYKLSGLILSVSALLFAIGCSDDKNNNMTAPQTDKSKVRVIHASYDAPPVDISVDGTVAVSSLAYGKSSGYAEVNSGVRAVKVTPAGTTAPVVINANLPVQANQEYTIIAVNEVASIEPIVTVDNRAPNSQKARVRFVHASPDAPAVDIKVATGNSAPVFSNAKFRDISAYVEVDQGNYQFVVTPAGQTTEVLVYNTAPLMNGMVYTVVAHGTFDPSDNFPFTVRVFVDNDPGDAYADLSMANTNVLVIHASPDAPGVDLLVDNNVINTSPLNFPDNTGYLPIHAGSRNIRVNAAGTSSSVINATVTFSADQFYSVFAVNDLMNIEPLVLMDNLSTPADGKVHVRFIHLSPDAPAVDITLNDGTIIFGNKAFKEYTNFTLLNAGTYDLQVRAAGTSTVVLELPGIALTAGKIYTIFARGFLYTESTAALGAEIIVNK